MKLLEARETSAAAPARTAVCLLAVIVAGGQGGGGGRGREAVGAARARPGVRSRHMGVMLCCMLSVSECESV